MDFKRKLPIPMEVKEQYPVPPEALEAKAAADREIAAVFNGESAKRLLIIGPCSADREDAVLEYCRRLREVGDRVKDKLIIIPRVFTNKPRTTGGGYKGMLHQPDPNERPDPFGGILATRRLHASVLTQTGLVTADEMLYPANLRYLSDLLSYVSVGARSTENQEHRLTASGTSVPVGMKNPTCGDLSVMINSVFAARHGHTFIYRGWHVETTGNPLTHAILRGGVDENGAFVPNYGREHLLAALEGFGAMNIENPSVIVDTNHANSGRNFELQPDICRSVLDSCAAEADISHFVKGFMIESYLEDGCQPISENEVFGRSITDPCLGWEKTERLILKIADMI